VDGIQAKDWNQLTSEERKLIYQYLNLKLTNNFYQQLAIVKLRILFKSVPFPVLFSSLASIFAFVILACLPFQRESMMTAMGLGIGLAFPFAVLRKQII
jgi:hypothetical protein